MDDDAKLKAMIALLHFIEAERILRPYAHQFETEHPELFSEHVDGVRAELKNQKWRADKDHRTLAPLLKILAPHKGANAGLALLPYYAAEYKHVVDLRNAIGHGNWEELEELGGSEKAIAWAKSFYSLVAGCTQRKLDEGFARAEARMERIIAVVDRHDRQYERIAAREARWRGAGKWLAGIAASVVVAVLMMVLGLRR